MCGLLVILKEWQELTGAMLGFGAAIATFLWNERRKSLHQFRGIFRELAYIKKGVDVFVFGADVNAMIEDLRKKGLKRPHWRFSPTTLFYETHASNLGLREEIQDEVIGVYNDIFTARADIEAVNSDAFLEISDAGREKGLRWRFDELRRLSERIQQVKADMRRCRPTGVKLPKDEE